VAQAVKLASSLSSEAIIAVCLSGRGDKDAETALNVLGE
jgi:tryptophan synthase beta subunit